MARKQVNTRALGKLVEAAAIVKRNYRASAKEACRFIDELAAMITRGGTFQVVYDGSEFEVDPMRLRIHKTRIDFDTAPALELHLGLIETGDEPGEYVTWEDGGDGYGERVTLALKDGDDQTRPRIQSGCVMSDAATSEQPDWMGAYLAEADEDGYVPFNGDRRLGQNQYISRYANGSLGNPDLGAGLRWKGDPSDYHFLLIHKDDLLTFHQRVEEHKQKGQLGFARLRQTILR